MKSADKWPKGFNFRVNSENNIYVYCTWPLLGSIVNNIDGAKISSQYPPDQNNSLYAIKHIFIKIAYGQKLWGVHQRHPAGMWGFESSDTGALLIEERGRWQLAYIWRNKLIYARKDIKEIFTRLKKTEYVFQKYVHDARAY